MDVGQIIRKERKKKKITQKKLAELTGIAEITIRQYEAGKYQPKIENLNKIASVLEVDVDTLQPYTREDLFERVKSLYNSPKAGPREIKKIDALYEALVVNAFRELNKTGREKAAKYIEDLTKIPEYRQD